MAPKAYLRKYSHWDEEMVWELAQEGWANLSQKTINKWCDSMPERLQAVIDAEGKMTSY
jgi:hypothetical protein